MLHYRLLIAIRRRGRRLDLIKFVPLSWILFQARFALSKLKNLKFQLGVRLKIHIKSAS